MTAAHSQLLPQHDVFPESPRAKRYTLVAFAAAFGVAAVFALSDGTELAALLAVAAVALYWAWNVRELEGSAASDEKLRE